MDKRIYLSLLAPLIIAGCGGGSDGGSPAPTPKYTIDFASFYVQKTDRTTTNCSIYDETVFYKEQDPSDPNYDPDAEPEIDYREWVLANEIRDTRLRVVIHGADGAVLKSFSTVDSEWSSTGNLSIKKSQVPNDGYLTIYESIVRPGGTSILDSVSYQKSLLTSSMRFNSFRPNEGQGNCITSGKNFPKLQEKEQTLEDGGDSSGQVFAINTRNEDFWATSPINVPAKLDSEQLLAARYERLDSDTKDNVNESIQQNKYRLINAYKLFKRGNISNKPLAMHEIGDDRRDD
ncbi:hypothetical protein BZJ17_13080 [Salinivibrio sp. IB574]|uniref:hypothetical protein n=1 Tax=Salinivibrio sp. IB574 TaxID=1909444 RepID=UPI000988ACC8|nr:hypothetical protein [Salinivibrio sp. IB574]OOF20384.1 hypothetical protein BZJ17_13080 [Salinivibrio sp. IB574]